jgi:redox-sensing transcriptional repressor
MIKLPEKTVERLSIYRRTLLDCLAAGKTHIYSHELANLHNITAVQVRRDIMFIGYSSMQRKGYDVSDLIDVIGRIIDADESLNVAIIGIGNLGRAITTYFKGKRSMQNLEALVKEKNISIAILTVPADTAVGTTEKLVASGVRGILNFTTVPLNVPSNIHLEEYDMITSLEKVAYFVKKQGG